MEQAYQFVINNCVSYLERLTEEQIATGECQNAFSMSTVIAIAFCKSKEEVVHDIIMTGKKRTS
jgi:hypothetical protein